MSVVRSLLVAIGLLCSSAVALWPTWSADTWRGTEARRVQIAREMRLPVPDLHAPKATGGVATTDGLASWWVPRLGGEPTLTKPPLSYWILAATDDLSESLPGLFSVLPERMRLRLPSLLGWWGLAVLAFRVLARRFDAGAGVVGAVGILTLPVLVQHGASAEIDPLFGALGGASVLVLLETVVFRRGAARAFGLCVAGLLAGLAVLTKGPPLLMLWAGPIMVLARRRPGAMWAVAGWSGGTALLLVGAYFVPLLAWWVDPAELGAVASRESIGRVLGVRWEQWGDLPLHCMRMLAMTLPLGLLFSHEIRGQAILGGHGAASGLAGRRGESMQRAVSGSQAVSDRELLVRGCASVWLVTLLVLAMFPARPTRYALPALPLGVVALAPIATAWMRAGNEISGGLQSLVRILGVVGGLVLIATPWLPPPWSTPLSVLGGASLGFGWAGASCFGLALGVLPWLARTRVRLIAALLLLPVLAVHTLLVTYQARERFRSRLGVAEALWLERQARALSIPPEAVATRGHVPPEFLLSWSTPLPGDEFLRQAPAADWLLVEDTDREVLVDASTNPGYVDRVRLRGRGKSVVLQQRMGDGR